MKQLKWVLYRVEEILCGICLITMMILLFMQVLNRYLFKGALGLAWTAEAASFAFLFMVYIGASLAAKENEHIRITAQLKVFPQKYLKYILLLADFIWLLFCIIITMEGVKLVNGMADMPFRSGAARWDLRWIFSVIPITFLLQSYRIIDRHYNGLKYGYTDSLTKGLVKNDC